MKSDFSRFLHNFLSHSNLIGVSRLNKVANLFHLDIRVKPEYDDVMCKKRLKYDFILKISSKSWF